MSVGLRRVLVLRGEHEAELVPRFGLATIVRLANRPGIVVSEHATVAAYAESQPRWVIFAGDPPRESAQALGAALGTPTVSVESSLDGALELATFMYGMLVEELTLSPPGPTANTESGRVPQGWRAVVLPERLADFPDGWPDPSQPLEEQVAALAELLGVSAGDLWGAPTSPLRDERVLRSAATLRYGT